MSYLGGDNVSPLKPKVITDRAVIEVEGKVSKDMAERKEFLLATDSVESDWLLGFPEHVCLGPLVGTCSTQSTAAGLLTLNRRSLNRATGEIALGLTSFASTT